MRHAWGPTPKGLRVHCAGRNPTTSHQPLPSTPPPHALQLLIAEAGALPVLFSLLERTAGSSMPCREAAAWTLSNLACCGDVRPHISVERVAPPLVALLQAGSEAGKQAAARALKSLSAGPSNSSKVGWGWIGSWEVGRGQGGRQARRGMSGSMQLVVYPAHVSAPTNPRSRVRRTACLFPLQLLPA